MKRPELPPIVEKMTSGRWPYVWITILFVFAFTQWALPPAVEAGDVREENAQERELVRSYRTLAGEEPSERARHNAALAWWNEHREGRARGASMALAATSAQERLRAVIEGAGATVMKLEALPADVVAEAPRSGVARLTVQFAVDRMEMLAEVLTRIESPQEGQSAGWFRVGNTTITRSAYSAITGVIVDATVYVWLEASS